MRRLATDPFLWILLLAALAVRLVGVDDPWSTRIWAGEFGGYATGAPATNLAQYGFWSTGGVPLEWRVVAADGEVFDQYYLNHPPTYMWFAGLFVWLFGTVEWGLRLLPVLASTAACAAGYVFARRFAGLRAARMAALVWAFAPYGLRDGLQLWTEVPIAALLALALVAYLRWYERGGRRAFVAMCLWYLGAVALDWPAHFFGPVIAVHALGLAIGTRSWRPLRAPLALGALSLLSIAAVWAHFGSVVGFDVLAQRFRDASASADGSHLVEQSGSDTSPVLTWGFWHTQLVGFRVGLTRPGAVLFVVGLAAALLARRPRRETALLLLAGLPGLLYVAAFPGRSANHLFFFTISLACYATLVGVGGEALARAAQQLFGRVVDRAGTAVALVTSLALVLAGLDAHRDLRAHAADDAMARLVSDPVLREILDDEQALIFTPAGFGAWLHFYARSSVVLRPYLTPAELGGLRANWLTRLGEESRAFVFLDEGGIDNHPALPAENRAVFRSMLDQLELFLARYDEPHVIEFTDNLGMQHRYQMFELPTGEAARSWQRPSDR